MYEEAGKWMVEKLSDDYEYRLLFVDYLIVHKRRLPKMLLKELNPEIAYELTSLYNKRARWWYWRKNTSEWNR
jgi:hypothetical protein